MTDRLSREISYLRLSVTDRCNLRCTYCMPAEGGPGLARKDILSYEELLRLAYLLAGVGVRRVRLTGGEPLLRKDLDRLVAGLKAVPGIEWVGLTTNGVLLKEQLPALLCAGLDGVNLSLDTLDREQYRQITRRDSLAEALEGLEAARSYSMLRVKLNCVPTALNRDQWVSLAALAQGTPVLDVRFIELMPIGLGIGIPRCEEAEILEALEGAFGPARSCPWEPGTGPARYVTFAGFAGRVGFISAVSHPFCHGCNRIRLTARGGLKPCLQYGLETDLAALLRGGASDEELSAQIGRIIWEKPAGHHFQCASALGDESRAMNQIGG